MSRTKATKLSGREF